LYLLFIIPPTPPPPLFPYTTLFRSAPPLTLKVHDMSKGPGIPKELLDLLEQMQVSYVVFRRGLISPEREAGFDTFFNDARATDRLRLIGRYGNADLYAVVKTEPAAQ